MSNEANDEGPQLISIVSAMLQHFGIPLNQVGLGGEQPKRDGTPELSVVESLALLQEDAMYIARNNGLGLKDAAQAAAMATAFIVKECAKKIGPEVGFNIAAYGFIEGCKTVPPAIGKDSPSDKKPWFTIW